MSNAMRRSPDSIEDLTDNPELFGMPTMEEFRRNRDRYVGRKDDMVTAIDAGDPFLRCRQKYFIVSPGGQRYRADSLEQAERFALDMGADLHQNFDIKPQLRPDGAGSFYNEVTFVSKAFKATREKW